MDQLSRAGHHSVFENIKRKKDQEIEYWSARQLSTIIGYSEYRHFLPVIAKAKEACANSGYIISDHFEDVLEMVALGSGAKRNIEDVKLSRYACYLIVQNADPSKEIVALGQTYFAVQTRKQELIERSDYQSLKTEDERRLFLRDQLKVHNRQLASVAKNAGVVAQQIMRFSRIMDIRGCTVAWGRLLFIAVRG
jgi:DNA-damage-inducible protein D